MNVAVVSNSELVREGAAIHDFKHPDRGSDGSRRPLTLHGSAFHD
jgi:UDP-glucose 6-dehydrogenase